MSEWFPISTYPNNGRPVLGFHPGLAKAGYLRGFMVIARIDPKPVGVDPCFTHWMPLPEPPQEPPR